VESVKDYAIFMLDPDGFVRSWNPGAERIKGYTADEIIGKHFSVFYPQREAERGLCEHELDVAGREGRFEDEGWRIRKDGTQFWANVVITALRDANGALVGFGKVTRDLTARREAEQEAVRRARAEEAGRRQEELLSVVGHELRNPLAPIVTALHMIKLRCGQRCEREIAVVERQIEQMTRLLDDMRDVSRVLRGDLSLSVEVVEIRDVLASALDVLSPQIGRKGQRLDVDVQEDALYVEADARRIARVFASLLHNASKYTEASGNIRVRAVGRADEVEVTVEDTGAGIASALIPQLFELFTPWKERNDRRLGGLGVGLAVAKRLVEAHHGRIEASSEGPGKGSQFRVRLPRAQAPARTLSSSPPTRSHSVRRRVLIVDDDADAAEMARILLKQLGHEVIIAHDGPEAVTAAREAPPDVAFLDIGLPSMSGFELVGLLRKIPECAAIPIIAVSGYAGPADRDRAIEAGFTSHIAKPIDISSLEKIVETGVVVPP
jgi:PAS domain S-box-containing protein